MLFHSLDSGRIPLLVEENHILAVHVSILAVAAQFTETPHERRGRSVVLQTPHAAAGTRLAVAPDGDVPHLHTAVAVAPVEATVDKQSATDACSDGDEDHVGSPFCGPEQRLAQRHDIGVVAGDDRQPRSDFDTVGQRDIFPARDVFRAAQYRPAVGRDHARSSDADPGQFQALARGILPAGGDAAQKLFQHGFRPILRKGRQLAVEKHLPGGGDHGVLHRSAAEVYSNCIAFHRHALSTQIGELQPHWPSRWRTRT